MLHFDGTVENSYELITPNDYEVTLTAEWKETKSTKKHFINCAFTIRKDVEQDFQGRMVFDGIYESKKTGALQTSKINGILSAIPNAKQDFESYDELIQYISGRNMIVSIDIEDADPQNPDSKDRNVIKYLSYAPTKHKTKVEAMNEADADELPF